MDHVDLVYWMDHVEVYHCSSLLSYLMDRSHNNQNSLASCLDQTRQLLARNDVQQDG